MKQLPAFLLALVCVLSLAACGQPPDTVGENARATSSHPAREPYTDEAFCQMPADQLLDLFLQHGLVIPDALKATCTEEEFPIPYPYRGRASHIDTHRDIQSSPLKPAAARVKMKAIVPGGALPLPWADHNPKDRR